MKYFGGVIHVQYLIG